MNAAGAAVTSSKRRAATSNTPNLRTPRAPHKPIGKRQMREDTALIEKIKPEP